MHTICRAMLLSVLHNYPHKAKKWVLLLYFTVEATGAKEMQ